MAFGTDGEFALKTRELLRCSDDVAADVMGWNCILGLTNASRRCRAKRTSENEGEQDV